MAFFSPRVLVYLRQISRALTRHNALLEARLNLDHPDWERRSKPAKLTHMSVPTVEQWNKRYTELHPPPPNEG